MAVIRLYYRAHEIRKGTYMSESDAFGVDPSGDGGGCHCAGVHYARGEQGFVGVRRLRSSQVSVSFFASHHTPVDLR